MAIPDLLHESNYNTFDTEWYSAETFFIVKTSLDLLIVLLAIVCYTAILDTNYRNDESFGALLLVLVLNSITFQSLGYIFGIILGEYAINGVVMAMPILILYILIPNRDMSDVFVRIGKIMPQTQAQKHMLIFNYGFDACPEGEISSVMYNHQFYDDQFDASTHLLIIQAGFFQLLSYISLKLKVNWDSIQIKRLKKLI